MWCNNEHTCRLTGFAHYHYGGGLAARKPSAVIDFQDSQASLEEAKKQVSGMSCALTRACDELSKAGVAFLKEHRKVQGVLVEDYPESYWKAEERHEVALNKMLDADEAYWAARDVAKVAAADAAETAVNVAERRLVSFEAAVFATA